MAALCVAPALAQEAGSGGSVASSSATSAAAPAATATAITPERFASVALARLANLDLRFTQQATQSDHRIASYVFGLAQTLEPTDQTILRARLRAASAGAQDDVRERLLEAMVELDRSDTVVQLELVRARLSSRVHNADDRLRIYATVLTDSRFDASVRARIALEAALLHRDRGDEAKFVELLGQSLRLDPTYRDAAALAHAYYSPTTDDPIRKLELLVNLLLTDPIDPAIRFALSEQLASVGAFDAALLAHNRGVDLGNRFGRQASADMAFRGVMLEWQRNGPAAAATLLNRRLSTTRERVLSQSRIAAAGLRQPEVIDAATITLEPREEQARALAAFVIADRATLEDALINLKTAATNAALESEEVAQRAQAEPTNQQLVNLAPRYAQRAVLAVLDLNITRLLVNEQLSEAAEGRAQFEALAQQDPQLPAVGELYAALMALRNGDPATALSTLSDSGDANPAAWLCRALAHDALGDRASADQALVQGSISGPLSTAGAVTRSLLIQRQPKAAEVPLRPEASALAAMYRSIPRWVDDIVDEPARFLRVEVVPATQTPLPLEPYNLTVRVRNASDVALPLGPGKAVESEAMMIGRVDVGVTQVNEGQVPEVVDMYRRLVLPSRQAMEFPYWPEIGWAGYLGDSGLSSTTQYRWRLLLRPIFDERGAVRESPMTISAQSPMISRAALDLANVAMEELIRRIAVGSAEALPMVLASIRSRAMGPSTLHGPITEQQQRDIVAAITQRWPSLRWFERAAILATLPPARSVPAMAPLDDFVRQSENDPQVLVVFAITRASFSDDPALLRLIASGDESAAAVGLAHQQRLRDGRGGFALSLAPSAGR